MSASVYFIADIGTTTIKASLCASDRESEPLVSLSQKNAQTVFGLDVVSRVLYAHYNGVSSLQQKVLSQLSEMLRSLCRSADVPSEMISGIIITGNTVMLHLVRGFSVQGFEMAPFTPVTIEAAELAWGDLSESAVCPMETPVFFPPCIDAFLGADAVCAALQAVSSRSLRYPLLLADVGTNTEIMFMSSCGKTSVGYDGNQRKLICCSTAAGPAFEGGVLGGRCAGSELVHQLAELLENGIMDETGLLAEDTPVKKGQEKPSSLQVRLTQEEIRQLQLAKGAVCAALDTVLHEENLTVHDIGTFVLCGNFGSALSVSEAEKIGLFPAGLAAVTTYAGNAAEAGARLLIRDDMRVLAKKIAASGKLIQLADSRFFARRYIERMNFTR